MERTVFNKISTMPRNNNGEITILTEHLDVNNNLTAQQIKVLANALLASSGVLQPGTLSASGHEVTLTDFIGLNIDGVAVMSTSQQVNLSSIPSNTKCILTVEPIAGDTTTVNIIDSDTEEGLAHVFRVNIGKLTIWEGDSSDYPIVSDESVIVAKVTRGSSSTSIDEVNTDPPGLKGGGGGGADLPPIGDAGDVLTTVSGDWAAAPPLDPLALRVVKHDDDPDVERPPGISVRWIGSVEPNNAIIGDEWLDVEL